MSLNIGAQIVALRHVLGGRDTGPDSGICTPYLHVLCRRDTGPDSDIGACSRQARDVPSAYLNNDIGIFGAGAKQVQIMTSKYLYRTFQTGAIPAQIMASGTFPAGTRQAR
jgi:hypothetical protein